MDFKRIVEHIKRHTWRDFPPDVRGRTCIAVTHQPALYQCADLVYRLDNGRVFDVTDSETPSMVGGKQAV